MPFNNCHIPFCRSSAGIFSHITAHLMPYNSKHHVSLEPIRPQESKIHLVKASAKSNNPIEQTTVPKARLYKRPTKSLRLSCPLLSYLVARRMTHNPSRIHHNFSPRLVPGAGHASARTIGAPKPGPSSIPCKRAHLLCSVPPQECANSILSALESCRVNGERAFHARGPGTQRPARSRATTTTTTSGGSGGDEERRVTRERVWQVAYILVA